MSFRLIHIYIYIYIICVYIYIYIYIYISPMPSCMTCSDPQDARGVMPQAIVRPISVLRFWMSEGLVQAES